MGKTGRMFTLLVYTTSLYCVMANQFEYDDFDNDNQPLLGGLSTIPPNKIKNYPDLVEGIRKAEDNLNQGEKFDPNSVQATSQVVQGTLYRVNADVVSTSCLASCDILKHCSFKVWSRTWLKDDQNLLIQDFECS